MKTIPHESPTVTPEPDPDYDARAEALVARVRGDVATVSRGDVVIAFEAGDLYCVPATRAQVALHQVGGWPLVDGAESADRPPGPAVLVVLVFPDRSACVWLPIAPLTSSGGEA